MSDSSDEQTIKVNEGQKIPLKPRQVPVRTVFRYVAKPSPSDGRANPTTSPPISSSEVANPQKKLDNLAEQEGGENATTQPRPRIAGRDIKPLPMGDGAPPPESTDYKASLFWRRVIFLSLIFVLVLIFGSSVTVAFRLGYAEGRDQLLREQTATESARIRVLPAGDRESLNEALLAMAEGVDLVAVSTITGLAEKYPHVPSLKYLTAFTLLRAGRGIEAAEWANASVKANDRVGDCLAILAAIESDPVYTGSAITLADLKERQRRLLQKAVDADPGSHGALLDIAGLERLGGNSQKAEAAYRLAHSILPPVNPYLVIDVTLALIGVESTPTHKLKPSAPEAGDVVGMFREAYVSFLLDDFARGVSILRNLRQGLRPQDFNYLINDRAFRRFAYKDELQEFFK